LLFAQAPAPPPTGDKAPTRAKLRSFITQHRGIFNGVAVEYIASVAETILEDPSGRPAASLVSISYTKTGEKEAGTRPVTFIFNGGPGSSSVWLHMAAFSPRRAALPSDAKPTGAAPYTLVDNPYTLLDVSDLVFIDPIGTGYSRLLPGGKPEDFYGVIEDGRSMCDFLSTWLTANKRWNSPKFVAGESYGTIRAAEMAKQLPSYGILLNGVMLFGQAMDFTQTTPIPGFDMAYTLILPSMAATGWYWTGQRWDFATPRGPSNVAPDLFDAMRRNPTLRVFVAHGYYDLVTPYFASDYAFSHMGLDPVLRRNVLQEDYAGGHSMYTEKSVLTQMHNDVGEFIRTTTPAKRPTPSVQ